MGYDSASDDDDDQADEEVWKCDNCHSKCTTPKSVGRCTLTVADGNVRTDVWARESLVKQLCPKEASEWGEPASAKRRLVKHMFAEWVGRRYRAALHLQGGKLYCSNLQGLDGWGKRRKFA